MATLVQIDAIAAEITAAQAEYHDALENLPARQVEPKARRVKELRVALSDAITEGAVPCATCGQKPHGIRQPTGFEVGCLSLGCKDERPRDERPQGRIPEEAVARWNAEQAS